MKGFRPLTGFFSVTILTAILLPLFLMDGPWPLEARDYLEERGHADSGARNIVSAIYLGYRAFDTLGETIVLLLAVGGTLMVIGYDGSARDGTKEPLRPAARRTELLDAVTGKLGPVVLVFGLYVMMFGHLSPGGGFQGGAVVASGVVFLALGSRKAGTLRLCRSTSLARLEAAFFLLLLLASAAGILSGEGFFAPPLAAHGGQPVGYIILLNALIGIKVGAGIALICVVMLLESP